MRIHNVEQGSIEWFDLRLAKVTGTSFKNVFGSDNLSLIDRLIAESETRESSEDEMYVSDDMQRGIDLEPVARKEYEKHTKTKVTQVGFLQHEDLFDWFGLSSDGLVYIKKKLVGAVEIKCPTTKIHVKRIRQNQLPNDYKYQVKAHFIVSDEIQWVDFVSYDPRFLKRPLFIHRTTREEVAEEMAEMKNKMFEFQSKYHSIRDKITF
jgi:hypothetical protein